MAEVLTSVNWTPWTILVAVLFAFGVWFRESQKRADERLVASQKRADERRDRQDQFMRDLIGEMRIEGRADRAALQEVVRQNAESSQVLAQSFDKLCSEVRTGHAEIMARQDRGSV